jgi:hypothetical protein
VKQAIQFLVSGRRRSEAIFPYNKTYNVKAVNHVIVVFSSLVAKIQERLDYNRGFESLPHRQIPDTQQIARFRNIPRFRALEIRTRSTALASKASKAWRQHL